VMQSNALTQARLSYEANEQAERAAENEQRISRLSAESQISSSDVYDFGFNFIRINGFSELKKLDTYSLPHLNDAFMRGVTDSLKDPAIMEIALLHTKNLEDEKKQEEERHKRAKIKAELYWSSPEGKKIIAENERERKVRAESHNISQGIVYVIIPILFALIGLILWNTDQGFKAFLFVSAAFGCLFLIHESFNKNLTDFVENFVDKR